MDMKTPTAIIGRWILTVVMACVGTLALVYLATAYSLERDAQASEIACPTGYHLDRREESCVRNGWSPALESDALR